jgi:hypothetical protein
MGITANMDMVTGNTRWSTTVLENERNLRRTYSS